MWEPIENKEKDRVLLSRNMTHPLKHLLCLLAIGLTSAASAALPVAVLDFESYDEGSQGLGTKVASVITAQLATLPELTLIERAEIHKILSVQEEGQSGLVSPDSAAKVGRLIGAKVLVTGKVIRVEQDYLVTAKILSCETGRVLGETARGKASELLTSVAGSLATKLGSRLSSSSAELLAAEQPAVDAAKQLRQTLGNKPLPSVSISIPEQHYGAPANDPAAETEMSKILLNAGFVLLDQSHAAEADVRITGEAFSVAALRKGNLHSCKARVEIKAVHKSGRILASDRETSVSVDISEQTAAKNALQKSATDLALRFIPSVMQRLPAPQP